MASLDELKDLVQSTLEAKGVLGKLKVCAQLGAARVGGSMRANQPL